MAKVFATLVVASSAAQCSSDDQSKIQALDTNTFGEKSNKCGTGALGLTGINHDKFVSCMGDEVGISSDCGECYYTTAVYGFQNCKAKCLLGWCKQGCLDCTAPAQVDLPACTGIPAGSATPCLEAPATDEPCCKTCEAPLEKYHSVDVPHGFCGEACMDPSKYNIYKIFEKNLTKSDSDTPCAEQFTPTGTHYTEYSETVTHGVPGLLAVTLDLYGPGPELASSDPHQAWHKSEDEFEANTCSADIGHCGKAYQACCITYGAQGYPCGCSLSDGSGSSVGDCGTCGAAYQICCDGYKADGFACNCDVRGAGLFSV